MKLKKLRKRLGLSMRGLAKLTGISRQSILNYEKGRCTPGSVYWEILQRRLNITESYKRFWGKAFTERGRPRKYDRVACRYPRCRQRPASRGLCTAHYGMVRNRLLSVAPSWGPEAEEILKKLTMSKNTTLEDLANEPTS